MWRRAQAFVAANSGMKIQIATDMVIETYGAPATMQAVFAMKVLREPMTKTRDRITLTLDCGKYPVCPDRPARMEAKFNAYVRATK